MKKFLLACFSVAGLLSSQLVNAQSFTVSADTVTGIYNISSGNQFFYVDIATPSNNDSLQIKWHVIATNFPSDWLGGNLGICDNSQCHSNNPISLWNGASGALYTSDYYKGTNGAFDMQIDLSNATTTGTYYLTVHMADATTSTRTTQDVTFIVSKWPTGVTTINKINDNVVLYPNPAVNAINIVYNQSAGVKNIAVYNLIGKAVNVYKPVNNGSAQLDIQNIPSGIYFVRLLDAEGNAIATRRFTKQ